MSHVAKVDVEITSLDDLDAACKRLGLELVRGQQNYRWYGKSVGDYPLPEGFTAEDLGKCDHAIRIPLSEQQRTIAEWGEDPYEIGVVARRDGKPGYLLLWDFYAGGMGLVNYVGAARDSKHQETGQMPKLKQAYALCAAGRTARQLGYRVNEQFQADGSVQLFLTK